jgi:very-short-patch-repair endonuclease
MTGKNADLADGLMMMVQVAGLPKPERDAKLWRERFGRQFKADLCWRAEKLIVEVDGGTWVGGRHTRGQGVEDDSVKQNLAVLMGYRVMRVTARQVADGRALGWIEEALREGER